MKKMLKKISKLGLALALVLGGLMSYKGANVEAYDYPPANAEDYYEKPLAGGGSNNEFNLTVNESIDSKSVLLVVFCTTTGHGLQLSQDFKEININSWFSELPAGLNANLKPLAASTALNYNAFTIKFTGTPTKITSVQPQLTIPTGHLTHWNDGVAADMTYGGGGAFTLNVNDTLENTKTSTLEQIETDVTSKKAAINALKNLSVEQKTAACKKIDDLVTIANKAILDAATVADAKNALSTFTTGAQGIVDKTTTDDANIGAAKTFITNKLTANGTTITTVTEANYQQVLDAKAAYDVLAPAVKTEVTKLLTTKDYPALYEEAQVMKKGIDDAKTKAKNDIEEGATAKIAQINALKELTTDEKKTYIDVINTAKDTALKGIDESDTEVAIKDVKATFTNAANENYKKAHLSNGKKAAKRKYSEKAKEITDYIKTLDLADNEKKDFIDEINASILVANASFDGDKIYSDLVSNYEARLASLGGIGDKTVALAFTNSYLREEAGAAIYSEATSDNVDQILSGAKDYEALSDAQKTLVNEMIADATEYDTYDDYVEAVGTFVTDSAIKFIGDHLTKDDEVIQSATPKTYEMILGGEEDWNKLSETEKMVINESLKELGATQSYDEMLAAAKAAVNKTTTDFVKKYVSDEKGNVFKTVTKDNYAQILSGKDAWDKLSQTEKDAVNKVLTENGSKTFEELLKLAQKAKADAEGSKTASTGDTSNMALWVSMLTVSAGAVLLSQKKRRNI